MKWKKEYLDLLLVPAGMLIIFIYHALLIYKCIRRSDTTVIGYDNHCNIVWVKKMMQIPDVSKRSPAIQVLSSNISASLYMTSITLTLASLTGTIIAGTSSSSQEQISRFVYGDTRLSTYILKYICILAFFFIAYVGFMQSVRYFIQTNILISMPEADVPIECVEDAMIKGMYSWQIGLRSAYIASILLIWVFGPIPMFVGTILLVGALDVLDNNHNPLHEFGKPVKNREGESGSSDLLLG